MFLSAVPRLWIDGMEFGVRVLRGGENPWAVPEQVGLYYRELASLLSLDTVDIDIEAAIAGFRGAAPAGLADAAALEKLLGDPELEARISKGIEAIMGALGERALALSVPGPGRLARQFLTGAVDEDALDDLSLAITALVRAVFRPGIAFLRVTEEDPRALEFLSPLTNVAAHYGCTSLLVLLGEAAASDEATAFNIIYREASAGDGAVLPEAWWSDGGLPPEAHSLYAKIPPGGTPEDVLARLSDIARKMA
ncbi:MAG: hypothetical protein K8R18_11655 [Parvibaculum sp.]|uniref:hypothetical protein n=1 Tax=Parvibaculum sp. TaxID=2024848 RepID=UPI0025FE6E84|nr:hypothetical protein [Parvibaculum sp.]MCE9650266.1 hypothetical protein [Parvibaculum sp.]